MREPRVLLWDIGGVLLSNGWDEPSRAAAAHRVGFDPDAFERRHALAVPRYERGEISLDAYLAETLFYEPREFSPAEVARFIFSCSTPHSDAISLVEELARSSHRTMAALNNEGRELNDFRIRTFGLDRWLSLFFSSCFTGHRKPEPAAYRLVLDVLHRSADEVVFIDDRPENLVPARELGFRAIQFQTVDALRQELKSAGVR